MNVKICLISDTHTRKVEIEECDLLLHAGDLTFHGKKGETLEALDYLEGIPAKNKVFIAGNHELKWDRDKPQWLKERLANLKEGTYYLEDSGITLYGINIWGTPWQPEFCDWAFNLPRGEALREKYRLIPPETDILISHGPPYGVLDYIPERFMQIGQQDSRVGCIDLLNHVEQSKIKLHVFGHIHLDDRNIIKPVQRGSVTYINASLLDNRYELKVKPYYFNYET